LGAYYAPAPAGSPESSKKKAVLILTDAFGLPLKNPKIMADRIAKELQCDVWVPDLFDGWPLLPVNSLELPSRPGEKIGFFGYVKILFTVLPRIPAFYASRASVVDARIRKFIETVKAEQGYEKIGAAGYCFGGGLCVRLGATELVQSLVIAHPGGFSVEQAKAIKVPTAWECAEEDMSFPKKKREDVEALFAARKGANSYVEYEFKDYKGTTHGWAARPNLKIPEIEEAFEAAMQQTLSWFSRTL